MRRRSATQTRGVVPRITITLTFDPETSAELKGMADAASVKIPELVRVMVADHLKSDFGLEQIAWETAYVDARQEFIRRFNTFYAELQSTVEVPRR